MRFKSVQVTEIDKVKNADRGLWLVGSSEIADRTNEVLLVDGWKLDNYVKNPLFLWSHLYEEMPIGKAISVLKDIRSSGPNVLRMQVEFSTEKHSPLAEYAYNNYRDGYLNAFSVGYEILEPPRQSTEEEALRYKARKNRSCYLYPSNDLWEISGGTVPCNPEALAETDDKTVDGEFKILQDLVKKNVISQREAEEMHAKAVAKNPTKFGKPQTAEKTIVSFSNMSPDQIAAFVKTNEAAIRKALDPVNKSSKEAVGEAGKLTKNSDSWIYIVRDASEFDGKSGFQKFAIQQDPFVEGEKGLLKDGNEGIFKCVFYTSAGWKDEGVAAWISENSALLADTDSGKNVDAVDNKSNKSSGGPCDAKFAEQATAAIESLAKRVTSLETLLGSGSV